MSKDIKEQEGNKLIAEFMGAEWVDNEYYQFPKEYRMRPDELCYHVSWDWLMPVIDKISKLYDEESDNWLDKIFDDDFPRILELRISNPINFVWPEVVQFIQWYNKQKGG